MSRKAYPKADALFRNESTLGFVSVAIPDPAISLL
jgi:hypothetical protein